jgi:hypothetical protein
VEKKMWGKKCGYFFTLGIIVPPRTIRIASINPAIGTAVNMLNLDELGSNRIK